MSSCSEARSWGSEYAAIGVTGRACGSVQLRQWKFGSEERPPGRECFAVAPPPDVVDGYGRCSGRGPEQFSCTCLLGCVHAIADGRAKASRIGPLIVDSVCKSGEESLELALEAPTPAAV